MQIGLSLIPSVIYLRLLNIKLDLIFQTSGIREHISVIVQKLLCFIGLIDLQVKLEELSYCSLVIGIFCQVIQPSLFGLSKLTLES